MHTTTKWLLQEAEPSTKWLPQEVELNTKWLPRGAQMQTQKKGCQVLWTPGQGMLGAIYWEPRP